MQNRSTTVRLAALVFALVAAPALQAQLQRPRATLTPIAASDAVHAGAPAQVALRIELPGNLHANSNKPRDPLLIPMELTFEPAPGIVVEEIVWPEPSDLEQEGSELPLAVFEREFVIGVGLKLDAGLPPGEVTLAANLRYQACDEKMCYIPTTAQTGWTLRVVPPSTAVTATHAAVFGGIPFGSGEAPAAAAAGDNGGGDPPATIAGTQDALTALDGFTLMGSTGGYLGTGDFLGFVRDAESGVQQTGMFEGQGPLVILALVLIGGLALNLTPCVLPMIPINLAIIGAGAQAGTRMRGFLLGATYGGAMAVVYGVLGLIVILTAGTFGTINSSPWFNLAIAAIFVPLALAMFDVITIDFSRLSSRFRVNETSRGTFALAFSMGAIAALLAGACVAPVVIQVVLFSSNMYATGTTIALALPFLLGVGMALPWPIAGAGIASLPKPGPWMVRVKQAFGVFIMGTAIYYGYTAYTLFENRWVDADAVASSVEEKLKEGWYADLGEGLAVAQREQKPVLVDLWATWCKNCLTMDKTTLADEQVTAALSNYVKIKYQAENPDQPPAADVMQRFGAIGLPTYVVLKPNGMVAAAQ